MSLLHKAKTALKLYAIKWIFGKEGITMMAMFFAQRVILGKTTFEQVPKALKAGVAEVLIESGLPEPSTAERLVRANDRLFSWSRNRSNRRCAGLLPVPGREG